MEYFTPEFSDRVEVFLIHDTGAVALALVEVVAVLVGGMGEERQAQLSLPVEFDFDLNPLSDIEKLPKWIQEKIKKSETYQKKIQQAKDLKNAGVLSEVQDDGELPF